MRGCLLLLCFVSVCLCVACVVVVCIFVCFGIYFIVWGYTFCFFNLLYFSGSGGP